MNEKLYLKCKAKCLIPKHAAEIGVYYPETSNILGFIKEGVKTTLVEPLPECIKSIRKYFEGYGNVTLYPYAVGENSGTIELHLAESSTFAAGLSSSPALLNDNYVKSDERKLVVECRRFDELDDGTIDLLSIDTEGSEWFALKYMISRPRVISVEMKTKHYINPNFDVIMGWMKTNGYVVWYTKQSDYVFIKNGIFKLSFTEKFKNLFNK